MKRLKYFSITLLLTFIFMAVVAIAACGRKDVEKESETIYSSIIEPTSVEEIETEIQSVEEVISEVMYEEYIEPEIYYDSYTPEDLMILGVIYCGDWRFTWYSENVLPGGGLDIPGRWSDGNFVRDYEGYICCASEDLGYGSILDTPWGLAKVYDCGCPNGTIDIYTSW